MCVCMLSRKSACVCSAGGCAGTDTQPLEHRAPRMRRSTVSLCDRWRGPSGGSQRQDHLIHWRVTLCWANQRFPNFLRYGMVPETGGGPIPSAWKRESLKTVGACLEACQELRTSFPSLMDLFTQSTRQEVKCPVIPYVAEF